MTPNQKSSELEKRVLIESQELLIWAHSYEFAKEF
jgi:hypothetical protein